MDGYPELPFGGYRESGIGPRAGPPGDRTQFTETKTIQLQVGPRARSWLAALRRRTEMTDGRL